MCDIDVCLLKVEYVRSPCAWMTNKIRLSPALLMVMCDSSFGTCDSCYVSAAFRCIVNCEFALTSDYRGHGAACEAYRVCCLVRVYRLLWAHSVLWWTPWSVDGVHSSCADIFVW